MTKSKKIFTVLSCLMLLVVLSASIFMVGCAGEDTSTLTTTLSSKTQTLTIGQSRSSAFSDWGVTFTPGYVVEMYVKGTDNKYTETEIGPGKQTTSVTMNTYDHLVKNNFTVSGFDTTTATASTDGLKEEDLKNGVHYRVCSITYLGKTTSFKYTVGATATQQPQNPQG